MKTSRSRHYGENHDDRNMRCRLWITLALLLPATPCLPQDYTQRGFIESRLTAYPQKAGNDKTQAVGDVLFRYEGFYKPANSFQINGAFDLRTDTHLEVERKLRLSWWDRERRRPSLAIRRLSGVYHKGGLSIELGKQFIRWGKADILNPTDRFAPRDYLTVIDNDFFGITAARVIYEKGADTIDAVWSPRLTPSRVPLANHRWVVFPEDLPANLEIRDAGAHFPGGPQAGIRWSHIGLLEFSGAYYEGFNHLPSFDASLTSSADGSFAVDLHPYYPKLRMIGADAALPLHWFGVKGETAYFTSPDTRADQYVQYVLQVERHSGEWTLAGGYAGERLTKTGSRTAGFAPDRGLTKTFLGTARFTIDANRSLAFESSVRQSGDGLYARAEYSQAFGPHWRATTKFNLIRGKPADFIGQYRRNSHAMLIVRYSF